MAESALERYFDKYIANEPEGQDPSEDEDMNCDIFSLPDELLTLGRAAADKESRTRLDRSAQSPVTPVTPVTPQIQHPHVLPRVQNVVSMVDLGCSLNLTAIAHQVWNVQHNPGVLKALIMRIRKPRTTALFYSSGKMVSLGAKSVQDSYLATRRFGRIVQRLGFPVRFLDFKVVNIVANGRVPALRLEPLAQHHLSSYEPELFPSLFLKGFHGISISVFPSGHILMMGARTEEKVQQVFSSLVPFLSSFRRPSGIEPTAVNN